MDRTPCLSGDAEQCFPLPNGWWESNDENIRLAGGSVHRGKIFLKSIVACLSVTIHFPSAKFYLKQFIWLTVKLLEYINTPQSILETFYRDGQNPLPAVFLWVNICLKHSESIPLPGALLCSKPGMCSFSIVVSLRPYYYMRMETLTIIWPLVTVLIQENSKEVAELYFPLWYKCCGRLTSQITWRSFKHENPSQCLQWFVFWLITSCFAPFQW